MIKVGSIEQHIFQHLKNCGKCVAPIECFFLSRNPARQLNCRNHIWPEVVGRAQNIIAKPRRRGKFQSAIFAISLKALNEANYSTKHSIATQQG